MNFLMTGSPGVGKSLFSLRLKEALALKGIQTEVISVSDLVKQEKLYEEYDDRLDTIIMDDSKVNAYFVMTLN